MMLTYLWANSTGRWLSVSPLPDFGMLGSACFPELREKNLSEGPANSQRSARGLKGAQRISLQPERAPNPSLRIQNNKTTVSCGTCSNIGNIPEPPQWSFHFNREKAALDPSIRSSKFSDANLRALSSNAGTIPANGCRKTGTISCDL